jgi:hypothetical protein
MIFTTLINLKFYDSEKYCATFFFRVKIGWKLRIVDKTFSSFNTIYFQVPWFQSYKVVEKDI